jgi:hypothetical protein
MENRALNRTVVFELAQKRYERKRLLLSLSFGLAIACIPIGSLVLGGIRMSSIILSLLLVGGASTGVWLGGLRARAAVSGLKAGLIPLGLSHLANLTGHVCIPGRGCASLCIPACTLGGVLAGLLLERVARQTARPWLVRLVGGSLALSTGALGCSCVGYGGILGLILGVAFSLSFGIVRSLARPNA